MSPEQSLPGTLPTVGARGSRVGNSLHGAPQTSRAAFRVSTAARLNLNLPNVGQAVPAYNRLTDRRDNPSESRFRSDLVRGMRPDDRRD